MHSSGLPSDLRERRYQSVLAGYDGSTASLSSASLGKMKSNLSSNNMVLGLNVPAPTMVRPSSARNMRVAESASEAMAETGSAMTSRLRQNSVPLLDAHAKNDSQVTLTDLVVAPEQDNGKLNGDAAKNGKKDEDVRFHLGEER